MGDVGDPVTRLETGTRFGAYTIEGLVASGGMGEVYAARDLLYGSPVALKVLHPRLHADRSWRRRFNEEGLVGTRLKHPHVLSARELVEHDGRVALVMDLVSGGQTLEKAVQRFHPTGLPLVQALQVFLTIVQGVEYLHGKGIVHGDLKPDNVLVDGRHRDPSTWRARVTDFGTVALIAHPVSIGGRSAVVATPRYASPEHLLGIDRVDARSDIYALGLVLHFLLSGRHASEARTVEEAATWLLRPPPLVHLVDQPESVHAVFVKATSPDRADRHGSCRELALAVRDVLDGLGAGLELEDLGADLATEVDEESRARTPSGGPTVAMPSDAPFSPLPSLAPQRWTPLPVRPPEELEATEPVVTPIPPMARSEDAPPDVGTAVRTPVPSAPARRAPVWLWAAGGAAAALLVLAAWMTLGA